MLSNHETRATTPALQPIVPGVTGWRNVFVNLYYVGPAEQQAAGAPWVLVDAGLPASARHIRHHAAALFGADNPPRAILLTHGHFDHVSALPDLLEAWPGVQVYAHPLELPYLTGRSSYPAPDPTVGGGGMSALSFLYPKKPLDLGRRVAPLPMDGSVPFLPEWRWVHTPGHTPGHVFVLPGARPHAAGRRRFHDGQGRIGGRYLDLSSRKYTTHRPTSPPTGKRPAPRWSGWPNWRRKWPPRGHGIAMRGDELRRQLRELAAHFRAQVPAQGRYVGHPAVADASGVVSVPPPLVSPWVKGLVVAGLVGFVVAQATRKRS